jgi:hypothetical protein
MQQCFLHTRAPVRMQPRQFAGNPCWSSPNRQDELHTLTTRELCLPLSPRLDCSKEAPKNLLVLSFSAEPRAPSLLLRQACSTTVRLLHSGVCPCPSVVWRSPAVQCRSSPISRSAQRLSRFLRLAMAGARELPVYQEARAPRRLGMAISGPDAAMCARGAWLAVCAARGQLTISASCAWSACPRLARAPSTRTVCVRHARDSLARPRRSLARILRNPGVSSLPSSSVPAAAPTQSAWHSGSLAVTSRRACSTSSCLATSSFGRPPSLRGEHRLRVGNLISLCRAF